MGVFRKSKGGNEAPDPGPPSSGIPGGIAAYRRTLGREPGEPLKPPEKGAEAAGTAKAPPPRRSSSPPPGPAFLKTGGEWESKYRRTAKFLILIGGDEAAGILSQLPADQVELISKEIASIRGISAEEARAVLEEFRALLSSSRAFSGASAGGVETARRLLYAAFGPEQGEACLTRAVPETRKNPMAFLEDLSGEQIALLLKD